MKSHARLLLKKILQYFFSLKGTAAAVAGAVGNDISGRKIHSSRDFRGDNSCIFKYRSISVSKAILVME